MKPFTEGKPSEVIRSNTIDAMSSLNMFPDRLPDSNEEMYLSESDRWAKHAYEHLNAVCEASREQYKKQQGVRDMIYKLWRTKKIPECIACNLLDMLNEL